MNDNNTVNSEKFKDFLNEYAIEDYQKIHADSVVSICKNNGDKISTLYTFNLKCSVVMSDVLNCIDLLFSHFCPVNMQVKSDECDDTRNYVEEWMRNSTLAE